jgi:TRAP-type C4-dicarboxylate transport system permease small subunit
MNIIFDVIMRYFFNAPTLWSGQLSEWLLCGSVLLASGYAFSKDAHVRVDVIYRYFSSSNIIPLLCFYWSGIMGRRHYGMESNKNR